MSRTEPRPGDWWCWTENEPPTWRCRESSHDVRQHFATGGPVSSGTSFPAPTECVIGSGAGLPSVAELLPAALERARERRGESTSARLEYERDNAVRIALDNRGEITRLQRAFAAAQADLTRAEQERDTLLSIVARIGDALSPTGERPAEALGSLADDVEAFVEAHELLGAELATARAELERLRPPTTRTGGAPSW